MDIETTKTIAHRLGHYAYFVDAPRDAGADSTLSAMYVDAGENRSYVELVHAWYEGYSEAAEAHAGIVRMARTDFGPNN
jgi:hypothetical protein